VVFRNEETSLNITFRTIMNTWDACTVLTVSSVFNYVTERKVLSLIVSDITRLSLGFSITRISRCNFLTLTKYRNISCKTTSTNAISRSDVFTAESTMNVATFVMSVIYHKCMSFYYDWLCRWSETYVSELRPLTGLLFIPRVNVSMKSHGNDDSGWRKLLTRPSELSGNTTSTDIWQRVGRMDEGMRILRISIWDTSTDP
jgi:hypothetical protein